MRSALASMFCLSIVPAARGDELILKDGRKIEGTILRDSGDAYEIEVEKGGRAAIKKSEVQMIVPVVRTAPAAPLTGATFTFHKGRKLETIDLLAKVDLKGVTSGTWKFAGNSLLGTTGDPIHSKLPTTWVPPEEYDLTVSAERREGADDFTVGLVGGGRQFVFHFDSWKAHWTGMSLVDGKNPTSNGFQTVVFQKGKARTATFMVRKEAFIVQVDGKDFFSWKADWSRVSLMPELAIKDRNVVFIGTYQSSFVVSRLIANVPKN